VTLEVETVPDEGVAVVASAPAGVHPRPIDWFVLLVLVAIWGSTYAVVRIAVRSIDPAWLVAGRQGGAAVLIAAWLGATHLFASSRPAAGAPPYEPVSARAIFWFSLVGIVFNAVPLTLYALAAKTTPSAVLAICNGGTPIFTALAAHLIFADDRLTPRRAIGVAMGFGGLIVLVGPELAGESAGAAGLTLAIIGALLYAGSGIGARFAPRISPTASTLIIMLSGALVALPTAFIAAPFPTHATPEAIVALAALAAIPSAFAFVIWIWLIQRTGAVFVSLSNYMMPLWATVLGVVLMHETIGWTAAVALGLIFAGVAIASRKPRVSRSTP
jgi:drug/metabolite transporter (DMT)-like permease